MNVWQRCLLATLLLALTAVGGCASTPVAYDDELQRLAISRWQACLKRNIVKDSSIGRTNTVNLIQVCDGHKRDVLAAFPRSIEHKLDSLMVHRARQKMAGALLETTIDTTMDTDTPEPSLPVTLR